MAKEISTYIRLQVPAGQANPSPPIGPALGQHGVNIMEFCKVFNAQTQLIEGIEYNNKSQNNISGFLVWFQISLIIYII